MTQKKITPAKAIQYVWHNAMMSFTYRMNLLTMRIRRRMSMRGVLNGLDVFQWVDLRKDDRLQDHPMVTGAYLVECEHPGDSSPEFVKTYGNPLPPRDWLTVMKIRVDAGGKIDASAGIDGETWEQVIRFCPYPIKVQAYDIPKGKMG